MIDLIIPVGMILVLSQVINHFKHEPTAIYNMLYVK